MIENPPSIDIAGTATDWMAKIVVNDVAEAYFSLSNNHSDRLHPLEYRKFGFFGRLERSN